MKSTTKHRVPHLPASVRKAGATKIARCVGDTFAIGFALTPDPGSDETPEQYDARLSLPGSGPAVVAAIRAWLPDAEVEWKGEQRYGIIVKL